MLDTTHDEPLKFGVIKIRIHLRLMELAIHQGNTGGGKESRQGMANHMNEQGIDIMRDEGVT